MLESAQYGKETRTARGKRKMEVRIFIWQFSWVFGIIEFFFIKINYNYWFAGSESDDNVKDHELIVINKLV